LRFAQVADYFRAPELVAKLGAADFAVGRSIMKVAANQEVLHHRGNYLVRRQRLAPGEASPWHRDPFHRVTVVLGGDLLAIEFRDGSETQTWKVTVGEVDWMEPSDRVHRAVNVGKEVFEEVVTFFLDRPDAEPQPEM
jgi:quercetin dioxygenase-like cupin family protein